MSTETVARQVEAGICPVCGKGPYVVVAIHASKAHDINRFELRDMMGVNYNTSICDPDHAERCAERVPTSKRRGGTNSPRRFSKAAKQRLRDLSAQQATEHLEAVKARDAEIVALIKESRMTYGEIAAQVGVHDKTVANVARRAELPPQPGRQPKRPPRLCSVDGCNRVHKGHGLCRPHLRAARKDGTTDA